MSRLLVASALLVLSLVVVPPAGAVIMVCYPTFPSADIVDQPVDAPVILPLPLGGERFTCQLDTLQVEVRDADENLVAGTFAYDDLFTGVVWTPERPLAPAATYRVNGGLETYAEPMTFEILLHTRASALAPPEGVSIASGSIAEAEYAIIDRCWTPECDNISGSGRYDCGHTWVDRFAYAPQAVLTWSMQGAADALPWLLCDVVASSGEQSLGQKTVLCAAGAATLDVPSEAFPLCVGIHARLVGATQALAHSEPVCVVEGDYARLERQAPPWVDFSVCSQPEQYDEHPLNIRHMVPPCEGGMGACQVRATQTGSAWIVGLLALGLVALRRQRRRG